MFLLVSASEKFTSINGKIDYQHVKDSVIPKPVINIGSRLELFVDNYLIEKLTGKTEEELYTSQVKPYYRSPQLLIGFPARYTVRG